MLEREIEDVFERHYEQLIEKGLKLKGRQHILANKLRLDLVFEDANGKTVILELKRDAVAREDIGQLMQYAGQVANSRVILAAPIIPSAIKAAFEHYGIEYLEFDLAEISRLAKQPASSLREPVVSAIVERAIKVPLGRRVIDGNVAFKITYVDTDWNGVCSANIYNYNIANRRWCQEQSNHKQSCRHKQFADNSRLGVSHTPCYDAIALKTLSFYPGHFHSKSKSGLPIPCINAKLGKIALFTSREPGMPEDARFIFAIGQIGEFRKMAEGNEQNDTAEHFVCDKKSAIIFPKGKRPKYWQYHQNPNAPTKALWGTGLIRYINDKSARALLEAVSTESSYGAELQKRAADLLRGVFS